MLDHQKNIPTLRAVAMPERATSQKARESWHVLGIISEFIEAAERLSEIRPAVSIFGSARTRPDGPMYGLTVEIARKLSDSGFAVISGGGPGIMVLALVLIASVFAMDELRNWKVTDGQLDPVSVSQNIPWDALTVTALLYTPVLMLTWFSPQLVAWSNSGAEGTYRFLRRLWNFCNERQDSLKSRAALDIAALSAAQKALRRDIHANLKQADFDYARMQRHFRHDQGIF